MTALRKLLALGGCACAAAIAGCGSSGASSSGSSSSAAAAGALSAEARSAATGDIPDNQVFLVFTNRTAGYSIKYPEGWTQSGSGKDVTFKDKNNVVHVVIEAGPAPTAASVAAALRVLKGSSPTLSYRLGQLVQVGPQAAVKATYTTRSAPDPVTGRSVVLTVDRYALHQGARVAIVDLGTPVGVDNVDAYRMMIESFRFR